MALKWRSYDYKRILLRKYVKHKEQFFPTIC